MSAPNKNTLNENHGIAATGLNDPNTDPIGTTATGAAHQHQGRHTAGAAGAAGLAGREFEKHGNHHGHHYGVDAAVGAGVLEHEHHKHENRNAAVADDMKPSMGDKIKGNVEKMAGKVTGNEAKVIEGEQKAHGNRVL